MEVPIDFAPGVPAFRIDSAMQVPLDPTFPVSVFHVPWIVYLSADRAAGLTLALEILTERTPDGGLLMSATTERLDPTNPEHVRRSRTEPGCLLHSVHQNVEDPSVVVFLEHWEDRDQDAPLFAGVYE